MEQRHGTMATLNTVLGAASIFLLALAVRLAGLGREPLTPQEAELALQALAWLQEGRLASLPRIPLYPWWTGLGFFLTQPTDFWARWWPALLGAALTLVPWLLPGSLPRTVRAGLALAWALDPALILASRQADGPTWALVWALLLLVALYHRRPTLSLFLLVLMLSAGRAGWWSLLVMGLALALWRLQGLAQPAPPLRLQPVPLLALVWVALFGLGLYPMGLGGLFQGLVDLVQDLARNPWPLSMALWPLLAYQAPLVMLWLVFTRGGLRTHEPEPLNRAPALALAAAALWLLYPGRSPDLAVWLNLALWPGVVWGVYQGLPLSALRRASLGAWLLTGLHLALWFLLALQVALLIQDLGLPTSLLRAGLVGLTLALLVLSGFTWRTFLPAAQVRRHVLLALLLAALLAQVAGWARVLGPAQDRLWSSVVAAYNLRDLQTTWRNWSLWRYGWPDQLQGLSTLPNTPEVAWALRNARLTWSPTPPLVLTTPPEAVLTPAPAPGEPAQLPFTTTFLYRGQSFPFRLQLQPWETTRQGLLWLFHLQPARVQSQKLVLWLREDLSLQP